MSELTLNTLTLKSLKRQGLGKPWIDEKTKKVYTLTFQGVLNTETNELEKQLQRIKIKTDNCLKEYLIDVATNCLYSTGEDRQCVGIYDSITKTIEHTPKCLDDIEVRLFELKYKYLIDTKTNDLYDIHSHAFLGRYCKETDTIIKEQVDKIDEQHDLDEMWNKRN